MTSSAHAAPSEAGPAESSAPAPSLGPPAYEPQHPLRIVTAASLFDGHDAAINIMRRILQGSGAEVIHLGHNRSVREIVDCAIQEDAQGIALTSYQGGHVEYLKYMYDLLEERGASIKIFAGGGGTILPAEIEELQAYGIERVYSPDDGRAMGLQGMINDLLERCDRAAGSRDLAGDADRALDRDPQALARLLTTIENEPDQQAAIDQAIGDAQATHGEAATVPVLGITGTGGAGKSSLVDELVRRFLLDQPERTVAILSIDPSRRRTGGALLGDRIRMNSIDSPRVYMRSLATRQSNLAMSRHVTPAVRLLKAAGFDLVIVETSGIGQSDTEIVEHADVSLYVMTAEYGAATQLEKIDMLDFADVVAVNKFDKPGSLDALRDVRKQVQRNRGAFDKSPDDMPVYGTVASLFNDGGTHRLYHALMERLAERTGVPLNEGRGFAPAPHRRSDVLPADRNRYLAEIAESSDRYDQHVAEQADLARRLGHLHGAIAVLRAGEGAKKGPEAPAWPADLVPTTQPGDPDEVHALVRHATELARRMAPDARDALLGWAATLERYAGDTLAYAVRGRTLQQPLVWTSLSGTTVRKVELPRTHDWGEVVKWVLTENVPGSFPFSAGVFPLKREGEDPARMFAGEGGPERTNHRFHYLSRGMPAARLSTAFDSVTLYGENPDRRPDIYGKIGNSGVSVATLDDAKILYSGFDLADPKTSVSMTINGPAPMLLAFFLNAAIDQQCEKHIAAQGLEAEVDRRIDEIFAGRGLPRPRYRGELPEGHDGLGLMLLGVTGREVLPLADYERIRAETLAKVRGTVQADILKEDQAQNTCIFSTEFALRMMADVQAWFIAHDVRNFYSVSISGYHIAEAGANPITQLAFTLANGFTYVEYYRSRGMDVDAFAPNLSFFFSNGLDPEYAVIGRVARRIWAKALRDVYGANRRSQQLKYHIQTSGRSLHAQEIAFNDIRTTLQALYALNDNCNSLHTNAYDEAITTPTEESVRRALAIQLVIAKELGLSKNENPLQGAFVIEALTDLVEQAVLEEFRRLSARGGVLGAMERMYQRTKIQEESLVYEAKKHSGELPIIGVNTFLDSKGSPTIVPAEVIRSTPEEREHAITSLEAFHRAHAEASRDALDRLQQAAVEDANLFDVLMDVATTCSLGQMSRALYDVGGQYRRNM